MRIYKTNRGIVIERNGHYYRSAETDWDKYINRDALFGAVLAELETLHEEKGVLAWLEAETCAPIGQQEVWAAGVTYLRSRDARMDESKESGGATFYDKVYSAERPELFFKATPQRVVGPGGCLRIRKDSDWNVPEPELTLFVNAAGHIAGYTIGNDMSSRSIEGENPLYLPQAKVYEQCAGLGPCLYVPPQPLPATTGIHIEIRRQDSVMYKDRTTLSQMKRTPEELVAFLYRECAFSNGCFLMTGTCLVPSNEFTLAPGDVVTIRIDEIGTLQHTVIQ